MKTLKNIHEGFFSNVGATGALYKNKVIEYLKNINAARNKYQNTIYISPITINDALKEINDAPDEWFNNGLGGVLAKTGEDSRRVFYLRRFFTQSLIITPDVFDSNITTLPNWFKLNDDFFSLYKNTYSVDDSLVIYIYNMQNLDPKEVIDFLKKFTAIKGIYIVDCPKFKNFEGFPKKIGEVGLTGEIRAVNMIDKRIKEVEKMGFKTCIIPESNKKLLKEKYKIDIIGVRTINEALQKIGLK